MSVVPLNFQSVLAHRIDRNRKDRFGKLARRNFFFAGPFILTIGTGAVFAEEADGINAFMAVFPSDAQRLVVDFF